MDITEADVRAGLEFLRKMSDGGVRDLADTINDGDALFIGHMVINTVRMQSDLRAEMAREARMEGER